MAEPIPETRRDGPVLHFLKELPSWCVIGLFVVLFLCVWHFSHDDFIPRIIDSLVGALLTAIVSNRQRLPAAKPVVKKTPLKKEEEV